MKNKALSYVHGITERHNMPASARSLGAHANLPKEHPLHGRPDLLASPPAPRGNPNLAPAKSARQDQDPVSNSRPGKQ